MRRSGAHDRAARNRILGLIRFSYPSAGGFAHEAPDPSRFLYAEDRMERRFRLFETFCLPSLIAQRDHEFETLVLIGEDLPTRWRRRLTEAIAALPGARLVALPPLLPHYPAIQRAYATVTPQDETHWTTFRLDDDDALSMDYVARLRALATGVLGFRAAETPFSISFHRGLLVTSAGEMAEVIEKLPPASGSALVVGAGQRDNIYRRNHRLLPQFFDHVSEASTLAFLRTVHRDNDSNPFSSGQRMALTDDRAGELVRASFPFALDSLRTL